MNKLVSLVKKIVAGPSLPPKTSRAQAVEPTFDLYDVTAFAAEIDLEALDVIAWAPVWMVRAERLLLFTLVFGLRPARYLEIGTLKGGSALVVSAAMDALDTDGRLFCVDPEPQIEPKVWSRIKHRTTLVRGYSPDVLQSVYESAADPFDLALIDGDHTYTGVLRDANGVLPFVADGGYLLFHDSFFPDIALALHDFATEHSDQIVDFGTLTREITLHSSPGAEPVRWGGLRLMQVRRDVGAV